jgi:hypothetical protein
MDNAFTNEEYFTANQNLEKAWDRWYAADDWWYAAYEEVEDAYADLWDLEEAWEEAEDNYENFDYDEDFVYITYDDWEAPDDFDTYFEYGVEDDAAADDACVDVDENGDPLVDENGDPVVCDEACVDVDENGDPVLDENGDPVVCPE